MKKFYTVLKKRIILSLTLIACAGLQAAAQEDSTGIPVSADTYVRSTTSDGSNTTNYGANTTFLVRNSTSSYMQLGLIKFDASAIMLPANIKLDSAKVFLTTGQTLNAAINVNLIAVSDATDGWNENTITWNSYKAGDVDTLGTIATTRVSAKGARYSWDITDHLRSEILQGNKIVSLAVFQDYNTGANTAFVTKDSLTDDINKPLLAVYTHSVPVKVVNFAITSSDTTAGIIALAWKTAIETNTSYAVVQRGTDSTNFTDISSHLTVQGTTSDTTNYSYADNTPTLGYTYYYRVKYVMSDNSIEYSDIISTPFYSTLSLGDAADSYVQLSAATTNYGTATKMLVKNDGTGNVLTRYSFLKFDLSGYTGTDVAHSAKLILHVNSSNTSVVSGATTWYLWRCLDNSWTETGITATNAPLRDSAYGSTGYLTSLKEAVNTDDVVEFDVPADVINNALAGDKILTLSITSNNVSTTDDVSFVTKDSSNTSVVPRLIIDMAVEASASPVTLSPLTAAAGKEAITLNWKSYTELNALHYIIERSPDGSNFVSIGTVAAAGNSSTVHSYTYTDGQPATGINYYRLKEEDNDGKYQYSNITSVNYNNVATSWSIYPNPVISGNTTIRFDNTGNLSRVLVSVMDLAGRKVVSQQSLVSNGVNHLSVNLAGLQAGLYLVTLHDDKGNKMGNAVKVIVK